MEGETFIVPGHLPNRWHKRGPSKQFQGYHQDVHSSQVASANQRSHFSSDYQNHFSNSHNGGYPSEDATFSHEYSNQFFAQQQGGYNRGQRQWHQYAGAHAAHQRKPITCAPCNRTFYSQQRMDEHLKDHVECPFPECKLSAHIKVIDQHINNQHMLINFEALQIDDETWIAERKKRFPTAQRAELRRAEQMAKLKRGEKLGINKKPFDNKKGVTNFKRGKNGFQKDSTVDKKAEQNEASSSTKDVNDISTEEKSKVNSRFKKQKRYERPSGPRKPSIEVDLFESSDEEVYGVRPFRGTKHFYESTGEMNYFSVNRVNRNSVESEIAISDEEEWETENKSENAITGTLMLGGALGSLMGAYTDSEEEENANTPALKPTASDERVNSSQITPLQDNKNIAGEKKDNSQSNGEVESRHKARRRPRGHKKGKVPANAKRPPTRRRRSLLERLLQADIIHERNIILQCVRFIVENNFFDENAKSDENVEPEGCQEIKTLGQEKQKNEENTEFRREESSVTECDSVKEVNLGTVMITECIDCEVTKDESCGSGEEVIHKSVDVPKMETAEKIEDNTELKDSIIQSEVTSKNEQCEACEVELNSSAITAKDTKQSILKDISAESDCHTSVIESGNGINNQCKRSVDIGSEVSPSEAQAKKQKVEEN